MARWLLRAVSGIVCVIAVTAPPAAVAATPDPAPPDTIATSENVFLPEDQDLTECVSALPEPGCGSEARGGWRQTLVFAGLGLALAFIVWRIARSARRGRRTPVGDAS